MSQTTNTSSRNRQAREHDVGGSSSNASPRYTGDSEWETKEALRQRELEEARARAAQMEKTMRWWSDCTANWREKWSKVRNERNKAREETKMLRNKLEMVSKDANGFKREAQELETQNQRLRKELQKIHLVMSKREGPDSDLDRLDKFEGDSSPPPPPPPLPPPTYGDSTGIKCDEIENTQPPPPNRDIEEYVLQGAVPKHAVELYKDNCLGGSEREILKFQNGEGREDPDNETPLVVESPVTGLERDIAKLIAESNEIQREMQQQQQQQQADRRKSTNESNNEYLLQKMSMLLLRLVEATRAILAEREEKTMELRKRCENEVETNRVTAMRALQELRNNCEIELSIAKAELYYETANREGMDHRLSELRAELERLQAENAAEWGKRERLETDKISLERENKQLRNEIRELQELVESRRARPASSVHSDLHLEMSDRSKDQIIIDVKHSCSKLKKVLSEKTTELSHALRRSEQYEAEVKRVRCRVDELKKELSAAQDEVDAATNSVRRLQRANEDLVQQLESANVQIEHFKNSSDNCASEVGTETTDGRGGRGDDDDDDDDDEDDDHNEQRESLDDYERRRV